MVITERLYVTNRQEWCQWLVEHYQTAKGVWLVHYRKHTGKPSLTYEEAVEEALCFGWIDSIQRHIDNESYAQRFTPRQDNSQWSETNLRRVKKLLKERKMTPAGLAKLGNLKDWDRET
jgi:uncharacterized protein YdeI (YjbR/CyaY-like superfamily)